MCGIVGYIGKRQAAPILLEGLHRLEYRGYDSAGIAVAHKGKLRVAKSKGKVRELDALQPQQASRARRASRHTRWATHGEPSDRNAHPHSDATAATRSFTTASSRTPRRSSAARAARRRVFSSETDTEVLAHLIALPMTARPLEDRGPRALRPVVGDVWPGGARCRAARPLVVARNGSPVILGIGDHEMFFASDVCRARPPHAERRASRRRRDRCGPRRRLRDARTSTARRRPRRRSTIDWTSEALDKGEFTHYMRKEIAEQPEAVRRTLSGRLDAALPHDASRRTGARRARAARHPPRQDPGLRLGLFAGCIGAQLIEQLARIPADAEPASEFRYRNPVIERDTLYIAVSQSGETFDTLAAVQEVKRKGGRVLASSTSSAARSPANAAAASISTPGRKSPSSRPRPSPARRWRWRCSPSISAGFAISRSPTARG